MSIMSQRAAERDEMPDDLGHALDVLDRAGMVAAWPKRPTPTDAANEAVERIAFHMVSLQDAINEGAFVSPEKRAAMAAFAQMCERMGLAS
jgi:hypothetical protein